MSSSQAPRHGSTAATATFRVVTNPSCNLGEAALQRYGIELTPQHAIVGGKAVDTRTVTSFAEVDRWVHDSPEFPHMVGSTANELAASLKRLVRDDPQVLILTTSRKVIQTYAAATTAARVVEGNVRTARIGVVDSRMTDAGFGLLTLAAGEASRARLDLRAAMSVLDTLAARGRFVFTVRSTDYLVKGGRASALKAWFGKLLDVNPVIEFVDGELRAVGTTPRRADPVQTLADDAVAKLAGRPVWLAVFHGGATDQAQALAASLAQRLDARFVMVRPLSPGVYIYCGPGALGYAALPVDDLPWAPPPPSGLLG